jgi:hypothetical protein
LKPSLILALTNEVGQLVTEDVELFRASGFNYFGYTEIWNLILSGVFHKELTV